VPVGDEASTALEVPHRPAGPAPRQPGRSALLLWLVPPAVAFLLANLLLWISATVSGRRFFSPVLWTRWDSHQYLNIAAVGYTHLFRCQPDQNVPVAHSLCGNAGWFPGYPWLIRAFEVTGLSPGASGTIIAALFYLGFLILVWTRFLNAKLDASNLSVLALAAFFFGSIYYRAVFPLSAEVFCMLLFLLFLARDRWLAAGVAGFAATVFYSTGFLLALVALIWMLRTGTGVTPRKRLEQLLLTCGLPLVGLLLVLVVEWIESGTWAAFYKVQAHYGYGGLHSPTSKFVHAVTPLFVGSPRLAQLTSLQALVVAVLMVGILVVALLKRRQLSNLDALALIAALIFWLFPLAIGAHVHLYRAEATLLPAAYLVRHLARPVQWAAVAVAIALAYPMSILFYRGTLI
jgi:hypothetical protein